MLLVVLAPLVVAGVGPEAPAFGRSIGSVAPQGKLNDPMGVAVSPDENGWIYVVDHGNARIQVFTPTGGYVGEWGRRGRGPGQFWDPTDIAISPDGRYAYVVDRGQRKIKRFQPEPSCFDPGGRQCFSGDKVKEWGHRGTGDWLFEAPTGIATDRQGNVYVTDWGVNDIEVFTPEGEFLRRIGGFGAGAGEMLRPADVEIGPDGRLWVADRDNDRLVFFKPDGTPDGAWDGGGRLFRPTGIAVDASGGFVVRDYDPSYRSPRAWRYTGDRRLVDEPRLLGGEETGGDFAFQGIAMLPSGVAVLADALAPDYNLLVLPLEGEPQALGGQRARELNQVGSPSAVAIDRDFFVISDVDNHRVLITDPNDGDRTVAYIGGGVFTDFDLPVPGGVAVHRYGPKYDDAVIYVASPSRNIVYLASPEYGSKLGQWGDGNPGPGDEGLWEPRAVAVGPEGDVYIADTLNHRIVRRSAYPEGKVLGMIGRRGTNPGELTFPSAVAVGPGGPEHEGGLIYTLEEGTHRLQAFTPEGEFVAVWPEPGGELPGRPPGGVVEPGYLWFPVALAADGEYVYVLEDDALDHTRIQVLAPQPGVPLTESVVAVFADGPGPGPGELWNPRGLAASPDGRILVADTDNNRVQLFGWLGAAPTATPEPSRTPGPTQTPPLTTTPPEPTTLAPSETPVTEAPTAEPTATSLPIDTPPQDRQPTPGQVFLPLALATRG